MMKERYEVEVTTTRRMIVEVDPEKFNNAKVARMLTVTPKIKDLVGHLTEVVKMFCAGKQAGIFGLYGLVRVNGDAGGRAMHHLDEGSGINILPISDNCATPVVRVEPIKWNKTKWNKTKCSRDSTKFNLVQ